MFKRLVCLFAGNLDFDCAGTGAGRSESFDGHGNGDQAGYGHHQNAGR